MKHEKEINQILRDLIYEDWMSDDDYNIAISQIFEAERIAYMRSGTYTNLKFSTNADVPFLIYAVSSSTD